APRHDKLMPAAVPSPSKEGEDSAVSAALQEPLGELKTLLHQLASSPEASYGRELVDRKSPGVSAKSQAVLVSDLITLSTAGADSRFVPLYLNKTAVLTATSLRQASETTPQPLQPADATNIKKQESGREPRPKVERPQIEQSSSTTTAALPASTSSSAVDGRGLQPTPAPASHSPPLVAEQVAVETTR